MATILKGGWVMAGLIPASLLALAIVIERTLYLYRAKKQSKELMTSVKDYLSVGDQDKAQEVCKESQTPLGNLLLVAIENKSKTEQEIQHLLEDSAKIEIPRLERFIPALATVAHITPMLGLLGTVTGMIKAFNVMAIQGTGNPAALAGGISEALITTATGLIIAIPALIAHNVLVQQVNAQVTDMEVFSARIVKSGESGKKWSSF